MHISCINVLVVYRAVAKSVNKNGVENLFSLLYKNDFRFST